MNMSMKTLILSASLTLLLAACSPVASLTRHIPPSPEPSTTPMSTPENASNLATKITPTPGWAVYTDTRLDLVFQLPAAWQRVERNGALHQFEGPNGYASFSDSLSPMFSADTVEEICQKEIDLANKKYQVLGQKPYGSQPEVISLQVDHQPACLVLPSADQDEYFDGNSILIAKYPADLEVKPGEPRYITMNADKYHIQSIAETIRFTASEARQPGEHLLKVSPSFRTDPSSTPIAKLTPTQPSGQVLPANFTLDDPAVQSIIKSYLVQNIGITAYGGNVYCAYEPLVEPHKGQNSSPVYIYLWTLCQEYYWDGQELQKGTGSSIPVAIELIKAPGGYQFNSYKVPGDGAFFPKDVRALFPPSTWNEIMPANQEDVDACNARSDQLEAEIEAEAKMEPHFPTLQPQPSNPSLLPTINANILSSANVHSYDLGGHAGMSALHNGYLYFTYFASPSQMFRLPLFADDPSPQEVIVSDFPDGSLDGASFIFDGNWLIFMDMPLSGNNNIWKVRAFNLITGEDQTILDEPGDNMSWPGPIFSADGDWVAWTRNSFSQSLNCTVNTLGLTNLKTHEVRELDQHCADYKWIWSIVRLAGSNLIVEQDMADNLGRHNHIWLFNLADNSKKIISGNFDGSMPVVSNPWVVWKVAQRYNKGTNLSIYNLDDGSMKQIETCPANLDPSDPSLYEDWITWVCTVPRASDKVYAYHIPDGNQITMSPSNTDQGIGSLEINDGWIAWDIGTKIHENGGHDILQWRVFP